MAKRKKTLRKVCIVGFAPETRELANEEPDDVEMWGMNLSYLFMKRADLWFQIHPRDHHIKKYGSVPGTYGRGRDHVESLVTLDVPVYMQEPDERIPKSVTYPLDKVWKDISRHLPADLKPYFTSTIAYAIALAIYEKVDVLKIYGINLSSSVEYISQRACVEFLLGMAAGRGIEVVVPRTSPLLSGALYARQNVQSDQEIAQERVLGWKNRYYAGWGNWYLLVGASQECMNWLVSLPEHTCDECGERLKHIATERLQAFHEHNQRLISEIENMKGGIREATAWLARFGGVDISAGNLPSITLPDGMDRPRAIEEDKEEDGD